MRHATAGFTLVETCVVVGICVIVALAAAPALSDTRDRQALRGAANELRADLQFLRSAAVARDRTLRFASSAAPSGSCYVLHAGSPGACSCDGTGRVACTGGTEVLKSVAFGLAGAPQLKASTAEIAIDPDRGTVTPTATLKLMSPRSGEAIEHVVNVMGRVRSCSPDARVPGYEAC